jgi:diguanylate cyclase (GGDEF)-like protein
MKNSPRTADIPVIFVTSLNAPEDETRALGVGAVDFITKPVNSSVVRARVRTHLTLKRQSDLLRRMTMTDGLTGIANRRCFDVMVDREWRRCERLGQPIVLILGDVDDFKAYNDHYGHLAGDTCLLSVAQALNGCVQRPPDLVARYGGEEFVAMLPHETLEGGLAVAERMVSAVRALAIPHARSSCADRVTVSLGVAQMVPTRDRAVCDLVAVADACLYESKAAGRDRLTVGAADNAGQAVEAY